MCSTLLLVITGDLYLPAPVCSSSLQYKEGLQTDVGRYKSPVLVIMDTVPNIDESYSIAPPLTSRNRQTPEISYQQSLVLNLQ